MLKVSTVVGVCSSSSVPGPGQEEDKVDAETVFSPMGIKLIEMLQALDTFQHLFLLLKKLLSLEVSTF